MEKNYEISKIKLENFYLIWNSRKNMFNYKDIKNNNINYNEHEITIYKELIKILLDTLYEQLIALNKKIKNNNEKDIKKIYENIPDDIKIILEKSILNNIKLKEIIKEYNNLEDYKIDTTLYDLQQYCDNLNDILEMFFEKDKWYNERKKYLNSEEGKELYNIYKKYI